jgi:hypothetical protein
MSTPRLSALAPSAVTMIKSDHAAALALFRKIRPEGSDMVREATVRQLCAALEIHAQVEEELFYPALRGIEMTTAMLEQSSADHDEMRTNLNRLRNAGRGEAQLQALNELMNGVMHHMADEETRLLPLAASALGPERLSELGAQMTRRKLELTKPQAGRMALDAVRAAPAKTGMIAAALLGMMAWWMLARPRHERWHAR